LGYIVDQLQRDHSVKYIPPQSYEDDTYRIKNEFKAILVGDWGTGNSNATFLVKEAAKLSPDYFIHLGDVYYTGTVDEQNLNYVTPLQKYLPHTQIFSVPGNHDYYSGSQGYQWACSQFGQKHSYFILENDHIQIHGIDAAMKNIDPLNTEEASHLNADEVRWHLEHIKDTNKHVIMCEHFPLFSYNSTISGDCLDLDQYAALAPCIDKVTAWFWGHQHQFQLYKPYTFPNGEVLQKARLIGAGSFNTDSNLDLLYTQNKYSGKYPVPELVEGDEWHTQYNGETISNSFGVLEGKMVDGKYVLSMTYYQIPTPDVGVYETAVVCYQEILN
jgi:predicted phosphodiesterase